MAHGDIPLEKTKSTHNRVRHARAKITVIPHCIDLKRIEKSAGKKNHDNAETANEPTIFYGGRLNAEKGIGELIECYQSLLKETSVRLVLIGNGPLRDWILGKKKQIERVRVECVPECAWLDP